MHRSATLVGLAVAVLVGASLGLPAVVGLSTAAAVAPVVDVGCEGLQTLAVDDLGLCTHGPDTAPAAAAGGSGAGPPVPRRALSCIGNGVSGQRVEVLYLHGPSSPAASSSRRAQVLRWVEQVEWTVSESARRFGGERQVRWRTSGCELQITSVQLSNAALGNFNDMIKALRDRGYSRSDRTYLLFADATRYCGIATAPRDDSASNNKSDRTVGYARVDRGCWDTGDKGYHSIAAHELLHTLGAVQASAPNGTRGAHCTDGHDLMCYDDGTGGSVRIVCKDNDSSTHGAGDANARLLDCRGNDYFHPAPSSGSYLGRYWNTADSARLHDPNASKGSSSKPPSPTGDPVGYVFWLIFG